MNKLLLTTSLAALALGGCTKSNTCTPTNTWHAPAASCGTMEVKMPVIEPVSHIRLDADRIVLLEQVQFDVGSSHLMPVSEYLLNEVTELLNANPELELIRVEGHTSGEGDHDMNVALSNDRANEVRNYLIAQGVDANRLIARGYGPDQPIADNATEEGRILNRRVELMILQRSGETILEDVDPYAAPVEGAVEAVEEGFQKVEDAM